MRYFSRELVRGFKSLNFWIACLLCLAFFMFSFWYNRFTIENAHGYYLFYSVLFFGAVALLPVFAPIIAALPFSQSYLQDKDHHFLWGVMNRMTPQQYWRTKMLVTGILGALVLMLPLFLWLLINLVFLKNNKVPDLMTVAGPFSSLYNTRPLLFCLLLIGHSGLFGFIYADLALVVSLYIEKTYAVIAIPFLAYLLPSFVFPYLGLSRFEPTMTFIINLDPGSTYLTVYGGLLFVGALTSTLLVAKIRKAEQWLS
ncbi:hypothetical protein [Lapidilactobacillus bayanensis]|uniref:hypothetical protein n=1 Tax=Lapidilactobacillus bayanensis TaxID=2485998 RepID=UPI000F7802F1|nr:hypothetical protein [Lapidilactobacillus bayanensis]